MTPDAGGEVPAHADAVLEGEHLHRLQDLGPARAVRVCGAPARHHGPLARRHGRPGLGQAHRRHVRHEEGGPVQLQQGQVVAVSLRRELVAGVHNYLAGREEGNSGI